MKNASPLLLFALVFLQACMPRVRSNLTHVQFPSISEDYEIHVLIEDEPVPEGSDFVGEISIGDSGLTKNCGYETMISEAIELARVSGANFVSLTEVQAPDFKSTCYRISANLYRNLDATVVAQSEEKTRLVYASRLPADSEHALIHFYRPRKFIGAALSYKMRIEDEVIGKMRNGSYLTYEVKEFGMRKFWCKTETEESLYLKVEQGQEYFIKCGLQSGALIARPHLSLVENKAAIQQIKAMKKKN